MAKKKQEVKTSVISGYVICNPDKLERVINGTVGAEGQLSGGLGKDASEKAILAGYDKIGGLIRTRDGQKVETGSFYDFINKRPREDVKIAKNNKAGLKLNVENVGDDDKKSKKKEKKLKFEDE